MLKPLFSIFFYDSLLCFGVDEIKRDSYWFVGPPPKLWAMQLGKKMRIRETPPTFGIQDDCFFLQNFINVNKIIVGNKSTIGRLVHPFN